MADGVCVEGTRISAKETLMVDGVDLMSVSHKDCLNAKGLNASKPSFYIRDDNGELCSNFRLNGLVGVQAAEMLCGGGSSASDHVEFSTLCPNNEENCRKKRCADRYDSSESSDSGVVVLSCTDSSASSTSGTSDITDPGSPFSTASTHSSASEGSDDSSGASPCKVYSWDAMAPNVPSRDAGPNWGWYGKERDEGCSPPLVALSTPLSTVTANVIANLPTDPLKRPAADRKTAATRKGIGSPSAKRQRVDRKVSRVQGKVTPCIPLCDQQKNKCCCDDPVANAAPDIILQQHQEKITHYFKAQGQLFNGANNDGAVANTAPEFRYPSVHLLGRKCVSDSKSSENELENYFPSLISGNKPVSSPKSVDGKSDTVTPPSIAVSPWDKCDVDSRTSNVSQVVVEKNNNTTTAKSPAHCRKSVAQKVLFVKRNCVKVLPSQSLSAQKLDDFLGSSALPKLGSLFPPPSATQNGSTGKLATPECLSKPNKPSSSATSKVASISNSNNNNISCSLPKPLVPDVEVLLVKLDQDSSKSPLKPKTVSEKESSSLSCSLPEPASSSETSSSCLSVNISSAAVCLPPPPLGSPILSTPRTIRFPAAQRGDAASGRRQRDGSLPEQLDGIVCKWDSCNNCFDTSTGLLDHLQAKHVNPQVPGEHYVCLWVGCKVYDHMSCSRSWLERHVLSHGGKEVHSCIIKGCGRRFSSQVALQRHVNNHLNQSEGSNAGNAAKRGVDNTNNKPIRRNGKKFRLRRQPYSARKYDFFDAGMMEGLQHRLIKMTQQRTLGDLATAPGHTMRLCSKVMARRVEMDGSTRLLLRWFPEHILEDEWVLESNIERIRDVPLTSLPASASDHVRTALYDMDGSLAKSLFTKQKRKSTKKT